MKKISPVFPFLVLLFMVSCDPDDTSVPIDSTPEYIVETIVPTGDEQYLNKDSDYIFDQNTLHTFELNLPASALTQIDANPAAEQYVEGSLTFEGETISPVGIRYKGSIGAFVNCLSGGNWSNPSGHKTCTKLSMKVKINWDGREEKFYGLKKLQFHSMNLDDSQMRERLGYWLFRQMGVPAPRAVHARLLINGSFAGLFALVEQIDGRFARYNFDDGTGNVYKEIWPVDMNGQPYSSFTYLNNLETNKDENPNAQIIRKFGEEIAAADESAMQEVVMKWMDVDKIMAYAAVDRTIRHDDGPFHWYCNGPNCSNHNYFWYEDPTEEKLHLIPWDIDNAFENIILNANPVTPIADEWGHITADCAPFPFGFFSYRQRSAACDKLTAGWVSFEDEYELMLQQLKEGPMSAAQADAMINVWEAQIWDATMEADQLHSDAITFSEWQNALKNLGDQVKYAREH